MFDIDSQRSVKEVETLDILPDIHKTAGEEDVTDIFSFGRDNFLCWITDPDYFPAKLKSIEEEEGSEGVYESLLMCRRILFGPEKKSGIQQENNIIQFHTTPQPSFNKNFELLAKEISEEGIAATGFLYFVAAQARRRG